MLVSLYPFIFLFFYFFVPPSQYTHKHIDMSLEMLLPMIVGLFVIIPPKNGIGNQHFPQGKVLFVRYIDIIY